MRKEQPQESFGIVQVRRLGVSIMKPGEDRLPKGVGVEVGIPSFIESPFGVKNSSPNLEKGVRLLRSVVGVWRDILRRWYTVAKVMLPSPARLTTVSGHIVAEGLVVLNRIQRLPVRVTFCQDCSHILR